MIYPAFVTSLALIMYMIFGALVSRARGKYGIKAPATTGNLEFERYYRVHMNTLEQMVVVLPAMWLFAVFWLRPDIAAGIGSMWILGRVAYAVGYYRDAEKRYAGYGISALCTLALAVGAFAAIALQMYKLLHP